MDVRGIARAKAPTCMSAAVSGGRGHRCIGIVLVELSRDVLLDRQPTRAEPSTPRFWTVRLAGVQREGTGGRHDAG
jgi:hypothetical protein